VIRHGQTDWNAELRMQGQQDIGLNALGRSQATQNGKALRQRLGPQSADFDYVASPLGRTRETMELLRTAMHLDPAGYRTDKRLLEVSFGDWEGFTLEELEQSTPEGIAARNAAKWDFIPPGEDAESYEILSWRVGSWLKSVERPTVCVAHGGVIRSLFRLVADMPKEEASATPQPQDRILKIETSTGTIEWLPAS
jgi:probable phosphoglycerate mutase